MRSVTDYYRTKESRWGYRFVLKGIRHFGYYESDGQTGHAQAQLNMMRQVGDSLKLKAGSKVLDSGCGEGATAVYLAQEYGWQLTGIDLLQESVDIAHRKAKAAGTSADFQVGSFMKLPFRDNEFDGLYALESFIHASDPVAVLKEFKRVLKPGGSLVIADYTTNSTGVTSKYREVFQKAADGTSAPGLLIIGHSFYEQQLAKLGFSGVKVRNVTDRVMPMLRLFRRMAFIPYQLVRITGQQVRLANTTMGYYGVKVAQEDWWRFVIVSAYKPDVAKKK